MALKNGIELSSSVFERASKSGQKLKVYSNNNRILNTYLIQFKFTNNLVEFYLQFLIIY